jgi:hypothetical protein
VIRAAAVCAAASLVLLAAPARAHPYDAFVVVRDEDDLDELAARGAIDDAAREALAELLARGVELDTADRGALYALPNLTWAEVDAIVAFRAAHGGVRDPHELVDAGAISRAELDAIRAFLVARGAPGRVHGMLELQARAAQDDRAPPATMVRARVLAGERVTLGLGAILTRLRVGAAAWDPARAAIVVAPPSIGFEVPKLYARWQDDRAIAIAGSFRAGFGERLVFDDSLAPAPDGVYADDRIARGGGLVRGCDETAGELAASPCAGDATYVTPDFRARDGLFGVAAGARAIPLGGGALEAYGFASYHRRSIYQYELYDAARCADPRATGAACAAPPLFVRESDGPAAGLAYQTVPDVFREALAGGNATWRADRRSWIGVTGYGAETRGLLAGADLGYQEWADRPGANGDRFGALGVDAGIGRAWLDAGAEIARSVDAMRPAPGRIVHGGGGDAAIVRATATLPRDVVELVLRWYGVDFVDPYARPIAERDALEGERARDEAGARARWLARRGAYALHAQLDVWALPAEGALRTNDLVRVDVRGRAIGWGAWLRYEDRALGSPGRGACFDSTPGAGASPDDAPAGAPSLCRGKRVSAAARATWRASDALDVTAQLTERVLDDPRHPTGLRDDVAAWAIADWRARPRVRVHGRARFLWQDVATPAYLEESLWATADVTLGLRDGDALRVRADAYAWLDRRASTLARAPNPELWLWLEYALAY